MWQDNNPAYTGITGGELSITAKFPGSVILTSPLRGLICEKRAVELNLTVPLSIAA